MHIKCPSQMANRFKISIVQYVYAKYTFALHIQLKKMIFIPQVLTLLLMKSDLDLDLQIDLDQ